MPLFEQYYQGMMQAKWNRFSGEITGLEDANYTEDEISNAIASDPVLRHNMSQFKKVGPQSKEAKAFLAPYSPHLAETGLMGDVGPVGMGVAGATAYSLGKVGFDWANATPDDILLEAKTKFTDLIKADKDAIADAKKMLKDAKSPGDKKAAQELLKEARQNLKTTAQKGKTEYQKLVKENKRWNKLSKGEWGKRLKHFKTLRGFAPTLLGETTGWAAELIGGEKAGAVVKGGTAAAVGGAQGMSIGRFILKKLAAKSPAMFAKAGIAAAADGPFPFGEAVALALTLGTSYSTITDAINEWKQANRVTR
jgi:vacuolar-type H+-ATPase subunit H